jgi:hypothetical protein
LGRLRRRMPSLTTCSRPRSMRTVTGRPAKWNPTGCCRPGEADQAGGVDGAVDLDRVAGLTDRQRWCTGGTATISEQPLQVGGCAPSSMGESAPAAGRCCAGSHR